MIGSGPPGARGRIAIGDSADQLLHSSSVPVLLARLREQAAADLRTAARGQARRLRAEVEVLEGRDVARALDATSWLPGEVIICASSDTEPLGRVFLGDTSMKIVRASTSPVMILPRRPWANGVCGQTMTK